MCVSKTESAEGFARGFRKKLLQIFVVTVVGNLEAPTHQIASTLITGIVSMHKDDFTVKHMLDSFVDLCYTGGRNSEIQGEPLMGGVPVPHVNLVLLHA